MSAFIILALCGAGGALIYAGPVYLKAIGQEPPAQFATWYLFLAVFVGAICAGLLTNFIGHRWDWTVQPEPYPLALVIGIASNSLIPVLLGKLVSFAEGYNIGVSKK